MFRETVLMPMRLRVVLQVCELEDTQSAVNEAALAKRRTLGHSLRGSPFFLQGVTGRGVGRGPLAADQKVMRIMGVSTTTAPRFMRSSSGFTWADAQLVRFLASLCVSLPMASTGPPLSWCPLFCCEPFAVFVNGLC